MQIEHLESIPIQSQVQESWKATSYHAIHYLKDKHHKQKITETMLCTYQVKKG